MRVRQDTNREERGASVRARSAAKTQKDDAVEERFNETLDLQFYRDGDLVSDPAEFNTRLAPWLVEYTAVRPHATLDLLTPLEFPEKHRIRRIWSSITPVDLRRIPSETPDVC
ncbi:MAG: transposase [Holophagales bacterium]|nr:transposase [Holophagales bacterium]MBK9963704.1 transposase [Holophagales bacterium]